MINELIVDKFKYELENIIYNISEIEFKIDMIIEENKSYIHEFNRINIIRDLAKPLEKELKNLKDRSRFIEYNLNLVPQLNLI